MIYWFLQNKVRSQTSGWSFRRHLLYSGFPASASPMGKVTSFHLTSPANLPLAPVATDSNRFSAQLILLWASPGLHQFNIEVSTSYSCRNKVFCEMTIVCYSPLRQHDIIHCADSHSARRFEALPGSCSTLLCRRSLPEKVGYSSLYGFQLNNTSISIIIGDRNPLPARIFPSRPRRQSDKYHPARTATTVVNDYRTLIIFLIGHSYHKSVLPDKCKRK